MFHSPAAAGGKTLVDVLVGAAVVAILGMLALPSFTDYQQRSRRSDATSALEVLAANQEQYFMSNFTYTTDVELLGLAGGKSAAGYYLISVDAADGQGFTARAVPVADNSQAGDAGCQVFTINAAHERLAEPDPDGDCW